MELFWEGQARLKEKVIEVKMRVIRGCAFPGRRDGPSSRAGVNSSRGEEAHVPSPGAWRRLWPEQDRLAEVGNCYLGEEGWGHWSSWVPELSKHRPSSVYWQTLTLWAALSSVLTSQEFIENGCPWSHRLLGPWWLNRLMCIGSISRRS